MLQLLALAAVVAIAASMPVSHLSKDDEADMALEDSQLFKDDEVDTALEDSQLFKDDKADTAPEDLEVLADSLEKETGTRNDPDCCPKGRYGPSKSHCQPCHPGETSESSQKSNGECRNTRIEQCKSLGNNKSTKGATSCPRGQYGQDTKNCQDCDAGETSDVGYNNRKSDCFKCNICQTLSGGQCEDKCPTATVPRKRACSLTKTKDFQKNNVEPGTCYRA